MEALTQEKKEKRKKKIYPLVFILGLLLTVGFLCFFAQSKVRQKKEAAYHMLELYGVRTEALLDGLFHKTDVLESVVITNHGEIDKETFDNLAEALINKKGIRAIQCLPGGVVQYCYPLEGNEKAIGGNIFENPGRKDDALLAKETKEIALSGPYNLTQGGFGLVARNPIFINDQDGNEQFWGFSVVVLDLPKALEPLMLSEMTKAGYEYRLKCEVNGERVIVDKSADQETENGKTKQSLLDGRAGMDYVEIPINVPNHVWQLQATPKSGWVDGWSLLLQGIVGICFTFLCTAIVYLQERQNWQMKQYATTDELTGLFNRRRLNEYMDIRCRDGKMMFAMFYIDINRFKEINDAMGHAVGDAVLVESGHRIKAGIGKEGSVYRIGGDEFIAIQELDVGGEECAAVEHRIREELEKPFPYDKYNIQITASIGCVQFPTEGTMPDELLKLADQKMYEEKNKHQAEYQ